MKYFDYVYYRICKAYKATVDRTPEFSAVCILTVIQCLSIMEIDSFFNNNIVDINIYVILLIYIVLLILNYIRYVFQNRHSFLELDIKWGKEKYSTLKGTLVVLYIIITLLIIIIPGVLKSVV
jgi:hypothetical protein